ncbi:MAG: ATP-binding protein [Pelagibacteraceae bacterium]|tara:strand:- start:243 stop:1775 length:1533 start_codon:yes stop_codon:yes gene_type:complete
MKEKKSASILKKFLLFNFFVFLVLGIFTIIYLEAVQPNLVKKRTVNHSLIIKNTSDHLERLNVSFNKKGITQFLLSTRFLFQSLDRVQFYNTDGVLISDTNILDLDQRVFTKSDLVLEQNIDGNNLDTNKEKNLNQNEYDEKKGNSIKEIILKDFQGETLVLENEINKNFFVSTLKKIKINNNFVGYIMVTEEANDILFAVEERKNFILRTVFAVALVILIFSLFLNKYILKPIGFLVSYTESIKQKSEQPTHINKFFLRKDEIGKLTKSIDEMTTELQKRANRAETFSTDLAHEIRNPLASLKGASELLHKAKENEREKLFQIIDHDVERIERLITDYSQMLKDEASWSREKMKKIDLNEIVNNVVEDFNQSLINQNKNIDIKIVCKNKNGKGYFILGIENRLEQVIANLLDNSVSFSKDKSKIEIEISEKNKNFILTIKDEGPGFSETVVQNIFKRFYSNRPHSFGEHSGLGLNIVKNIIELHKGKVSASNRRNSQGAQIEVLLPKLV